jgi:hypothetical protein
MARQQPGKPKEDRASLLQLAWSPLRFFVLVLLVIEATFIFIGYQSGQDKSVLFLLNVVAIVAVAILVGVLAYLGVFEEQERKIVLPPYKIFIGPSTELPVDLNKIVWDDRKCYILVGKQERVQFTPAYPHDSKGGSLEVIIPSSNEIDEHAVIRLELVDILGNSWDVLPFRLWQARRELRPRSDERKIASDYRDDGEGQ